MQWEGGGCQSMFYSMCPSDIQSINNALSDFVKSVQQTTMQNIVTFVVEPHVRE